MICLTNAGLIADGGSSFPNTSVGQLQKMRDAARAFVSVMRDENQAGSGLDHDTIHHRQQGPALGSVEPLARFVEDEEARMFYRGTSEENQTLLAERKFTEQLVCVDGQAQIKKPLPGRLALGTRAGFVKADRVEEAGANHVDGFPLVRIMLV